MGVRKGRPFSFVLPAKTLTQQSVGAEIYSVHSAAYPSIDLSDQNQPKITLE